jgi:uncharacterized membrane protein
MSRAPGSPNHRLEQVLGRLLQIGVIAAAVVVFVGGVLYIIRHGTEPADYHVFHGEAAELRTVRGIATSVIGLHSQGLIQLGLLMLIATPVARVAFAVFAFLVQRDYTYFLVAFIVLAILLCSLFGG